MSKTKDKRKHLKSKSSRCPEVNIKKAEIYKGYKIWKSGGKSKEGRARRKREAEIVAPGLDHLFEEARHGRHMFRTPRKLTIPKSNGVRVIAHPWPEDGILLEALMIRFAKNPRFTSLFLHSYAYTGRGGAILSVKDLLSSLSVIVEDLGSVAVVAFDIQKCFSSLNAARAIDRAQENGMQVNICEALRRFYALMAEHPCFSGLQEGPCSSPILAEFALKLLDELLTQETVFYSRYADNVVYVLPAEYDEKSARSFALKDLKEFNLKEGTQLKAHDWQHTQYTHDKGFLNPFFWMGFECDGVHVRPSETRVRRTKEDIKKALTDHDVKKAYDTINGFCNYYGRIVPVDTLHPYVQDLIRPLGRKDTPPPNRSVVMTSSPYFPIGDYVVSRHRPRESKRLGGVGSTCKSDPNREVQNNKDRRSARLVGRSSGPPSYDRMKKTRMPFNDGRGCQHSRFCEKKITDDNDRVLHKRRDLLLYARDVCETFFATDSRSGKEALEVILDAPNGMHRAIGAISQNRFRQLDDEPPEPGSPGYCGHGLYIERGGSELLFGLCPEHARQVARAYLFVDFYQENCLPVLLCDLPDEKCFYTIGTITGSTWWIPWVVAALIRGRCLGLYGSKKVDRAITGLRKIPVDYNRQVDKRTNELIAALDHDDRKELVKVADRLSDFARSL